jgi:uncharacterized membrane protein YphA (DoxX/SURF4 family)
MLVAILTAHSPWQHSLIGPGGFEKPLALMAMALCLMVQGGGKFSADYWLRKKPQTPPPAA